VSNPIKIILGVESIAMQFNLNSFLINFIEACSDIPTFLKKASNPLLVSFILCKNLKSFAETDQGKQISKIIDVGANEGQFTFMARYCWPHASIDCFEPDPQAFKLLEKNHVKDKLIRLHNCALGDTQGELILKLGITSAQNSFLIEYGKPTKGEIFVPVKTLDELYSEADLSNALLKIDVQGYEIKVLEGASKILNRLDFVLLEVSLGDLFEGGIQIDEIWSFLKEKGFVYNRIIDQYKDPSTRQILQMDVLFNRKLELSSN
jgi:FkbM family methyltransferase